MKTNSKQKVLSNAVDLNVPVWEIRYQVKKHFPFGFIIEFEETTILGWYAFEKDANAICGQLNGAFNLVKSLYALTTIMKVELSVHYLALAAIY